VKISAFQAVYCSIELEGNALYYVKQVGEKTNKSIPTLSGTKSKTLLADNVDPSF